VDDLKRDLLVAVLAVLTDAIPRPNLAAVLKTWSERCEEPLAEALKAATGLDDERFHALERLAAAHLKTHQDDLRLSLQALGAQSLTDNVLTEADGGDERTLASPTSEGEATIPMDQESHGEKELGFSLDPFLRAKASAGAKDERFRLLRPHAQGGIGQVWVARDSELQRDVAVKEIQPRYAGREDQRARFVLEAEITGSLEHPGIVPVYSLGRNAEGRPYYAMRFIRGESLLVALRRFHKNFSDETAGAAATDAVAGAKAVETENEEKQDPSTKDAETKDAETKDANKKASVRSKWGIEFRQLIGRFLDVCDAIDYAHSRGVLHRDLKPANIMLGPYGETLVVDWGLAKKIGTAEPARPKEEGDFDPPAADAAAAVEAGGTLPEGTQQGTTIGTPAYMSPEQAQGLIDQLGPASDVYSLGASLYELITGKAPFHEKKLSAVIAKVIAGDFPPPRALDRTIPAPLEAICLKAMAKKPEDRYGSVRALAQDLEHWLADEPTGAYAESQFEKMTRWFRRHRAWTFAGAAALVLVSTVAVVAAFVTEGARRGESTARVEAEANFGLAQDAVEEYLTNVSENTLLKEQESVDIRSLRHDLLKSALTYYERFAAQRKDDPRLREQLAKAYFRVGQITREIGSPTQAMSAFRSALAIWRPLVEANPKVHELAANLAECYLAMGKLESSEGNFPAALEVLSRSRTTVEQLVREKAEEPRYQSTLADCYSQIGIALAKLGKANESLEIHEKARAIQQGLIKQYPENLAYKMGLTENLNAIGYAHYKRPDNDAALKTFHEVRDICQALMQEMSYGRKPSWLLNLLALTLSNIGNIHKQSGEIEKALPFFDESIKYRSELADQHPSVTKYRAKLAVSYKEIAELEHDAHQDDKAIGSIKKAIAVYTDLVHSQPETVGFQNDLAWCWDDLGLRLDEARNNAEAKQAFDQAVTLERLAIKKSKSADDYRLTLCYYLDNLGEQSVDMGRPAEGLPHYEEALRIRGELSRSNPEDRRYIAEVVQARVVLGNIKRHLGDVDAARRLFADARTASEDALEKSPDDPRLQAQLAFALTGQAVLLAEEAQPEKAKPLLEDAADWFRQIAGRAEPESTLAQERERRSETLWYLSRVLRDLTLVADAARFDAERTDLWKTRAPGELVAFALKHLDQAKLIGYGKTPLSSRAAVVRDLDLDQAANEVILAISNGFKDLGKLKSAPEWQFLLRRADVKSAIEKRESLEQARGAQQARKTRHP
jgi:eukaryotic-like serine/threonine-protein kinase